MKTLSLFIHQLFHEIVKVRATRPGSRIEKPGEQTANPPPTRERKSFADDDSPPGYKVRWHH